MTQSDEDKFNNRGRFGKRDSVGFDERRRADRMRRYPLRRRQLRDWITRIFFEFAGNLGISTKPDDPFRP
jgi:hypothetical protein